MCIEISERGYRCVMMTGSNVCRILAPTSCNRLSHGSSALVHFIHLAICGEIMTRGVRRVRTYRLYCAWLHRSAPMAPPQLRR